MPRQSDPLAAHEAEAGNTGQKKKHERRQRNSGRRTNGEVLKNLVVVGSNNFTNPKPIEGNIRDEAKEDDFILRRIIY